MVIHKKSKSTSATSDTDVEMSAYNQNISANGHSQQSYNQAQRQSNSNNWSSGIVEPLPVYSPPLNLAQIQTSMAPNEHTSVRIESPGPPNIPSDRPPKYTN